MAKKRAKSSKNSTSKGMEMKMYNSDCKMCGCVPCCCGNSKSIGWIFLVLGVLYLLTDLGWMQWWTVSWWTILFLIAGFWYIKK